MKPPTNTDEQGCELSAAPESAGPHDPESDVPAPRSATHNRRRTGRIARLPKADRDEVNRMIRDGVPYREIIDALGELGRERGINHHHLSRWRQGGYQDWLKEEQHKESTLEALKQNEGTDVQETALRLAASQIHEILQGYKIESLKELLEKDPKNYAAIANCLAKLSKGSLDIEKFKEDVAEQRHQRQVELDKDKPRGISPETLKKIEEELNLL